MSWLLRHNWPWPLLAFLLGAVITWLLLDRRTKAAAEEPAEAEVREEALVGAAHAAASTHAPPRPERTTPPKHAAPSPNPTEPEVTPEPAVAAGSVVAKPVAKQPVPAPEPVVAEPEVVAEPVAPVEEPAAPAAKAEAEAAPEPAVVAEPEVVAEPVVTPEPVAAAEPEVVAEPVTPVEEPAEAEPAPAVQPAAEPEQATPVMAAEPEFSRLMDGGSSAEPTLFDDDTSPGDEVPVGRFGPGSADAVPHQGPPDGFTIKGNAQSMLFHTPDSPYYGRTKAEVWFRTEADAERSGFTKYVRKPRKSAQPGN
ncbi:hypothetical protein ACFVWG_40100 [Kribbella sp. NPDC058245]|uniref:sunset domain-containing protein n=1 Tax=Kribbella sp. NPDC058245 TaxID=3346399 RepID=UPI0036ECAF02